MGSSPTTPAIGKPLRNWPERYFYYFCKDGLKGEKSSENEIKSSKKVVWEIDYLERKEFNWFAAAAFTSWSMCV